MKTLAAFTIMFLAGAAQGQITVTNNSTPASLAAALAGPGVSLSSPALDADSAATGIFSTGPTANNYGLLGEGVVLSTGTATDYSTGPNTLSGSFPFGKSTNFGRYANPTQEGLLSPVTGTSNVFDVAQLDVDITTASARRVVFDVVYGTEEWSAYVGNIVDGFAVFVGGNAFNYALTPDGAVFNANNPNFPATPIAETELNNVIAPGGTARVRFTAFVPAGTTTLNFLIGDAIDYIFDSTVYLSPLTLTCPADLNGDGVVDDADFTIFSVAYNNLDDPRGDLNGDGITNDDDFTLFAPAYDNYYCDNCLADTNHDGQLDLDDYFLFFNWWDASDPRADVNHDGVLDLNDFFAFFNAWDSGCGQS